MPREAKPPAGRYEVIRDTREQVGQGWSFAPSRNCSGTTVGTLATGDYTIAGHEGEIVVERKGTIGEFAGNLYQARFEAELARMASFAHAYVVLEFTLDDVLDWPASSSIPRSRWASLRLTNFAFLRRLTELQVRHPHVHFIFAGTRGKEFAGSLFKRLVEMAGAGRKAA